MCFRSVFGVWRSVVDATAHAATSRLAAAESYRRLTVEASRSARNAKDNRTKRVRGLHTLCSEDANSRIYGFDVCFRGLGAGAAAEGAG